jgi:long-chain acyl-CoA synthetase
LLEDGKKNLLDYNSAEYTVKPDDCITFSYTSGTTGPPKAAMISHKNFASFMAATKTNKDCNFGPDDLGLSYLPLPHILEREFLYSLLYGGSKIVYFSGDVQKLKDDLAIAKPTLFLSVPRLYSRFYEVLKGKFA